MAAGGRQEPPFLRIHRVGQEGRVKLRFAAQDAITYDGTVAQIRERFGLKQDQTVYLWDKDKDMQETDADMQQAADAAQADPSSTLTMSLLPSHQLPVLADVGGDDAAAAGAPRSPANPHTKQGMPAGRERARERLVHEERRTMQDSKGDIQGRPPTGPLDPPREQKGSQQPEGYGVQDHGGKGWQEQHAPAPQPEAWEQPPPLQQQAPDTLTGKDSAKGEWGAQPQTPIETYTRKMPEMLAADQELGYELTYAQPPLPNTYALGPAKYTIMEEYIKECTGVGMTTTTFVTQTGETNVHTSYDCCGLANLCVFPSRRYRKSITFYDELIVVKTESKFACYPWQYAKYAVPKYQLVSVQVKKSDPASRGVAAVLPFIAGVTLLSLDISILTDGLGALCLLLAAIGILTPFLFRNYYISLQVNEGNDAPMGKWQSSLGALVGRRVAGLLGRLVRFVASACRGSKGLTTRTFAVNARPETEFIERYVYGPLGNTTESLHVLALMKHAGIADKLRIDNSGSEYVPLTAMTHQPQPPGVVGAAFGGADGADALGGLLTEMRDESMPLCGCCGPSEQNVFAFHQGGVRIETATRFAPFPEGFMRVAVPKLRVLGCKVEKVIGSFLKMALFLMALGLGLLVYGILKRKEWDHTYVGDGRHGNRCDYHPHHADHPLDCRVAAVLIAYGSIFVLLGSCCLFLPFFKYFQGYYVYLDVTERYRQWVSLPFADEPDTDFVFRYVYGPLSKWSAAYHCQAHLGKDDLVKTIQPNTVMAAIHPPLPAPFMTKVKAAPLDVDEGSQHGGPPDSEFDARHSTSSRSDLYKVAPAGGAAREPLHRPGSGSRRRSSAGWFDAAGQWQTAPGNADPPPARGESSRALSRATSEKRLVQLVPGRAGQSQLRLWGEGGEQHGPVDGSPSKDAESNALATSMP